MTSGVGFLAQSGSVIYVEREPRRGHAFQASLTRRAPNPALDPWAKAHGYLQRIAPR